MIEQYGVSQRRASGLLQMWRSTLRLQVHPREDGAVLTELRMILLDQIASTIVRSGGKTESHVMVVIQTLRG